MEYLPGYDGAANTGADAGKIEIMRQLESILDTDYAEISILSRKIEHFINNFDDRITLVQYRIRFFADIFKVCSKHHFPISLYLLSFYKISCIG